MIPLRNISSVNPVTMRQNTSEKYIQIVTSDGHEFWFMGFVSFEKASQHLLNTVSDFRARTNIVQPVAAWNCSLSLSLYIYISVCRWLYGLLFVKCLERFFYFLFVYSFVWRIRVKRFAFHFIFWSKLVNGEKKMKWWWCHIEERLEGELCVMVIARGHPP